jgi:hypothetical protein
MKHLSTLLLLITLLCSCRPVRPVTPGLIDTFGSYVSPTGDFTVEVTRREKSLVDFAVLKTSTRATLHKDYIGSDAMRWFLWWETPTRLWGYGSDLGYFEVFDFGSGGVTATTVTKTMPVPQFVWDRLPTTLQPRHPVARK